MENLDFIKKAPVLIFDLGGVIVDLNLQKCVKSFRNLGFANIAEYISTAHQNGVFKQAECGKISIAQYCAEIRKLMANDASDAQIRAAWTSMLAGAKPEKLALIKSLKKQAKQKIFLLSNVNEIAWAWCLRNVFERAGDSLNNYFDEVYLSYKMKLLKPDCEIFLQMLKQANVEAKDCVFFDDSPKNCAAAESVGIKTYLCESGKDWTLWF